jgi:hypothetical protein
MSDLIDKYYESFISFTFARILKLFFLKEQFIAPRRRLINSMLHNAIESLQHRKKIIHKRFDKQIRNNKA